MALFFFATINEHGGLMDFDFEKWARERRESKQKGVESLEGFRQYMLKKGFKYLVVHYEGCGDSGDCYEMEGYKTIKSFKNNINEGSEYIQHSKWEGNRSIDIPEKEAYSKGTRNQYSVFKALKEWNKKTGEDIDSWKITDLIDYDWYNNEGGSGQVVFNLKEGKVNVIGCRYTRAQYDITETLYISGKPAEYHYDDALYTD